MLRKKAWQYMAGTTLFFILHINGSNFLEEFRIIAKYLSHIFDTIGNLMVKTGVRFTSGVKHYSSLKKLSLLLGHALL